MSKNSLTSYSTQIGYSIIKRVAIYVLDYFVYAWVFTVKKSPTNTSNSSGLLAYTNFSCADAVVVKHFTASFPVQSASNWVVGEAACN